MVGTYRISNSSVILLYDVGTHKFVTLASLWLTVFSDVGFGAVRLC